MDAFLKTVEDFLTPVKLYAALGAFVVLVGAILGLYLTGRHAGSLSRQRHDAPIIEALTTGMGKWRDAAGAWEQAVGRQNDSIASLKRSSAARVATAEAKVKVAQRSRARTTTAVKAANDALATLSGETLESYQAADRTVREGLK